MNDPTRPLPVRVLRAAGWITLALAALAFAIGAVLKFDELAKIWAVVGGILLITSLASFLGARRGRGGLIAALVACTLLLLLPPVGTFLTIGIGLLASQSWPQIREYYGLHRRTA